VVISGGVNVGRNCFLGVNATVNNAIDIGDDCLLASGALVVKNIPENSILKGTKIVQSKSAKDYYKV
ncbi:MAG: DapH/DapD/GlmU-related protein, partial [Flavobacteriaceae bacterium]